MAQVIKLSRYRLLTIFGIEEVLRRRKAHFEYLEQIRYLELSVSPGVSRTALTAAYCQGLNPDIISGEKDLYEELRKSVFNWIAIGVANGGKLVFTFDADNGYIYIATPAALLLLKQELESFRADGKPDLYELIEI